MKLLKRAAATLITLALCSSAHAALKTQEVEYSDGDVKLRGHLSWDDSVQGKRPGVLVVHEWWGLNDYARKRADMLAEMGYVAFAVDMYGEGKVTEHGDTASAWMKQVTANVEAWRKRAVSGLEVLKKQEQVDDGKLAAIGYCFGGGTVMQLAYGGADLKGVASFHGPLPPAPEGTTVKPKVLAATGSADAFVPAERVQQFEQGLDKAKADWEVLVLGGARHSFTNPDAGKFGIENIAYDEKADKRSWAALQRFLKEIFM